MYIRSNGLLSKTKSNRKRQFLIHYFTALLILNLQIVFLYQEACMLQLQNQ